MRALPGAAGRGNVMDGLGLYAAAIQGLLFGLAVLVVLGGLDDLIVDIAYLVLRLRDRAVKSVETEESLKAAGRKYKVGKFPFMANGRAKANFATEGFVKLLVDAGTDRVLGCHVIGPAAGDLIHEICVAMEFGASAQDVALTCHAHPTFSEAMREAALACGDGAIHA